MLGYVGFAFTLVLYFDIINCKLWKGGMVHYVVNKGDFDGHSQNLIVSALTGIEREVCLRFLGSTLNQRAGDAMLLHIANPTKRQDCPTQQYDFDKRVIEMSIGYKCLNDKDISRIVLDMLKASILQTAQSNNSQTNSTNTAQDGKLYAASDRSYINSAYRAECLGEMDVPSGRRTMGREQAAETERYFANKIWPLGIVMYGLGPGLNGTEVDKKIRAAISTIEAASCVTFQPLATDNAMHKTNFLWLSEYSDEYPAQGFVSGNQTVSIHALAHGAPGHSAHTLYMLLRVLGAPMMSNRYDRDKYVTINWGHVDKPRAHMLEKEPKEAWFWGSGLDTYEYKSATHAPVNFMCTDCTLGEQTVQPIQDPFWSRSFAMGHREDLSPSDIKMLQLLYGAQCAQRHRTADVQDDANDQTTHKTDYQYEVYMDVGPQSIVTGSSNTKGGKKDLANKNDHITLKMMVQEISNGPLSPKHRPPILPSILTPSHRVAMKKKKRCPYMTSKQSEKTNKEQRLTPWQTYGIRRNKVSFEQESGNSTKSTMVVSRVEVLPPALPQIESRTMDRITLQSKVPQDDLAMKIDQKWPWEESEVNDKRSGRKESGNKINGKIKQGKKNNGKIESDIKTEAGVEKESGNKTQGKNESDIKPVTNDSISKANQKWPWEISEENDNKRHEKWPWEIPEQNYNRQQHKLWNESEENDNKEIDTKDSKSPASLSEASDDKKNDKKNTGKTLNGKKESDNKIKGKNESDIKPITNDSISKANQKWPWEKAEENDNKPHEKWPWEIPEQNNNIQQLKLWNESEENDNKEIDTDDIKSPVSLSEASDDKKNDKKNTGKTLNGKKKGDKNLNSKTQGDIRSEAGETILKIATTDTNRTVLEIRIMPATIVQYGDSVKEQRAQKPEPKKVKKPPKQRKQQPKGKKVFKNKNIRPKKLQKKTTKLLRHNNGTVKPQRRNLIRVSQKNVKRVIIKHGDIFKKLKKEIKHLGKKDIVKDKNGKKHKHVININGINIEIDDNGQATYISNNEFVVVKIEGNTLNNIERVIESLITYHNMELPAPLSQN